MKQLKIVVAACGAIVALIGAVMLYRNWLALGRVMATVRSYSSNAPADPTRSVLIMAAVIAVGFFLLGIAAVMPMRSFTERRIEAEARELAQARQRESESAMRIAQQMKKEAWRRENPGFFARLFGRRPATNPVADQPARDSSAQRGRDESAQHTANPGAWDGADPDAVGPDAVDVVSDGDTAAVSRTTEITE